MLNASYGKPANNVAIVQPRHGDKLETTFDTDVRTEPSKQGVGRESGEEKGSTFVDDSGEAMDIKVISGVDRKYI
jgi:hypothetical protein